MYKPFTLWLESRIDETSLEMKQHVNNSFAAHLNTDRIGLHNLRGTGIRRVSPNSRLGHKLSSNHIVVGKRGAYAMWEPNDNIWVPLPVNLMPAKEVLFAKSEPQPDIFTHKHHTHTLPLSAWQGSEY